MLTEKKEGNMKRTVKKLSSKLAPGLAHKYAKIDKIDKIETIENQLIDIQATLGALREEDTRLLQLRKALEKVEHYQPTYGITGVLNKTAREESRDRATTIQQYLEQLTNKRILDIGSSLGFFSFFLADRGAIVEGWDWSVDNCEATRLIQSLNGVENANFKVKELNLDTVQTIQPGSFDAVLVLSVFHHIIRFTGIDATRQLVKELFDRVPVMIVELAKKGEDPKLPWDDSQPDDELAIFDFVKDDITIKKIGEFPNHLSDKTRPLYLVERKKMVKVADHTYSYDTQQKLPYKLFPSTITSANRRYYFSNDAVIKEYELSGKYKSHNVAQIINEINVLLQIAGSGVYHAPELLDYDLSDPSRIRLAVKRVEGDNIGDTLKPHVPKTVVKWLNDIAKTLRDLRAAGYYHNDIRSWNVIVKANHAWLIDYGLAAPSDKDNDAVSLLWLAHALLTGEKEPLDRKETLLPSADVFKSDPQLSALYQYIKQNQPAIDYNEVVDLLVISTATTKKK